VSRSLLAAVHLAGVGALLAPFFVPHATGTEGVAHASDAPVLLALLLPALLAMAVAEVARGRLDSKGIALLGVLCALNAALRLPGGLAGASLFFFLPIVCGYVFGASFGFLLGALSFAVSAVVTAGVGPWLPFQMWAAGWVGAGAGLIRPLAARLRPQGFGELLALVAYGYVAGLLFGVVTDLWFWPYLAAGDASIGWSPGLGLARGARHFWAFYLATSLAWDASRAIANVVLVLALGRPTLRLLRRWQRRMWPVMQTTTPSFTYDPAPGTLTTWSRRRRTGSRLRT
jgi:energy-coupling factor transport system substrate-specific component